MESLVPLLRDLNSRQGELLTLITRFLQRYEPLDLHPLIDDDVVEATAALAETFETAARGLIYEHRAQSLPADRLAGALKPLIVQAGGSGGTAFDRDAAVVLRRLEQGAREQRVSEASNRRAFLDLLDRVLRKPVAEPEAATSEPDRTSRLIVP